MFGRISQLSIRPYPKFGKAIVWLIASILSTTSGWTQEQTAKITWVVSVPSDTPPNSKLYIAGSLDPLGPWQPNAFEMTPTGDGKYQASLEIPVGTRVEYKITRGSWATVEKLQDGSEIRNRIFSVRKPETLQLSVANWAIPKPKAVSTATGDLRWQDFHSQVLMAKRRITVWLPPEYRLKPQQRYPVVYLLDGQNIFDQQRSAFGGEWKADETAKKLAESESSRPLILVAIDNSKERISEYTPVADSLSGISQGGQADDFLRFIVTELKPWIDQQFRTQATPESTAIIGSSLGGLFVLHAMDNQPDVFGKGAAMSPSLFWGQEHMIERFSRVEPIESGNQKRQPKQRLWIDIGTQEGNTTQGQTQAVELTKKLSAALEQKHSDRFELHTTIEPDAKHHESAWAGRLPAALEFLFPN